MVMELQQVSQSELEGVEGGDWYTTMCAALGAVGGAALGIAGGTVLTGGNLYAGAAAGAAGGAAGYSAGKEWAGEGGSTNDGGGSSAQVRRR
jgi:hypothetical protein